MGENCKYNGKNNLSEKAIAFLKDKEVVTICPEILAGMPTPRACAELVNGVVMNDQGRNVDELFRNAVTLALSEIKGQQFDLVVLQSRSPTCGVNTVYDGTFSGKTIKGSGLFASAMKKAGYHVIDVEDIDEIMKDET